MKPLRMKVLKVVKPDEIQYPLQGRSTSGKDDPGLNEALGNHEPTLEAQDAKPGEESDQVDGNRDSFQQQLQSTMNHGWPS